MTNTNKEIVGWQFTDASGLSSRGFSNEELDGLGNNVGILPNLTSSRFENAMTQGEAPTFTNPDGPSCQESGVFMPCSMAQALYGKNEGSFFSMNHPYPIEASGRWRYSRSNSSLIFKLSGISSLDRIERIELDDNWDPRTWTLYGGGYELIVEQPPSVQSVGIGDVPLSETTRRRLEKAWDLLRRLRPSESCRKNVIDKLASELGFNFEDFLSFLEKGTEFYDGTKSETPVAGRVMHEQPANVRYGKNASVKSVFNTRTPGRRLNALTSITSRTLVVYFRPSAITEDTKSNAALVLHEALHGFGGILGGTSFFDQDIQEALFGRKDKRVGAPSGNITDYIKRHCF